MCKYLFCQNFPFILVSFDRINYVIIGKVVLQMALMKNHNVIIPIKPVFNKDKNNYCYNMLLEKCSNKDSNT